MLLFPKQNVFIFLIKELEKILLLKLFLKNKVTVNTLQVQILKEDFEIVGVVFLILRERIALAAMVLMSTHCLPTDHYLVFVEKSDACNLGCLRFHPVLFIM